MTVQVSDGSLTDTQALAVTVTNANEAPVITSDGGGDSAALSLAENTTAVTTVHATDEDLGTTLSYSISGGADAALFQIDATTGALSFKAAPNFEAPADAGGNNVYDVVVQASDGSLTDTQALAVTVTNLNETPVIDSNGGGSIATAPVAENVTAVTVVHATDEDAGATLTYSIIGGADAAKFHIDAVTGALSFLSAQNFEAPTDAGGDNVYDVTVQVSDGSLTDTQAIAVTVTNANEAPVITSDGGGDSAALSIAENTTAVTTVTASDVDTGTILSYSISGGADAALFTINVATGELSFKTAPDYAVPRDIGANNVYDVIVQTSDGELTDTQALAVTILPSEPYNIIEGIARRDVLRGTSHNDKIFGYGGKDVLFGNDGNDILDGGKDADSMRGGIGNDTYVVDNFADRVVEGGAEGTDGVLASVSTLRLSANVENLTFTTGGDHKGYGNTLANVMSGNAGADTLLGLSGNDTLHGLAGRDILLGGDGNDVLDGGAGADVMVGGTGDDTFIVDNEGDIVIDTPDSYTDTVFASISYKLNIFIENLVLTGTSSINGTGNAANNFIEGNAAANRLDGGRGNDTLTGGGGADTFVFSAKPDAATNVDVITDFSQSEGDHIALSLGAFSRLGATGGLTSDQFWSGAGVTAAHDASDRLIYNTSTGDLFYDADGTGAKASAILVAHLSNLPTLTLGDIQIIA